MTLGLCGYNFFLLNNKSYTTGICYRDTDKSTFTFIKQFKLEDKITVHFTKSLLCSPSTFFSPQLLTECRSSPEWYMYKYIKVACHIHRCSSTRCFISMKITEEQFTHSRILLVYVFLRVQCFIQSNL